MSPPLIRNISTNRSFGLSAHPGSSFAAGVREEGAIWSGPLEALNWEILGKVYPAGNQLDNGNYYLTSFQNTPWVQFDEQRILEWSPVGPVLSTLYTFPAPGDGSFIDPISNVMGVGVTTLGDSCYVFAQQKATPVSPIDNIVLRVSSGGGSSVVWSTPVVGGITALMGLTSSRTNNKVYFCYGEQININGFDLYEHTPGGGTVIVGSFSNFYQNSRPQRATFLESCNSYVWGDQSTGGLWMYRIDTNGPLLTPGFQSGNQVWSESVGNRWIGLSQLTPNPPEYLYWLSLDTDLTTGTYYYQTVTGVTAEPPPNNMIMSGCALDNSNTTISAISAGVSVDATVIVENVINLTDVPTSASSTCPGPFTREIIIQWPNVAVPLADASLPDLRGRTTLTRMATTSTAMVPNDPYWGQNFFDGSCQSLIRADVAGGTTTFRCIYTAASTLNTWQIGEDVEVQAPQFAADQNIYTLPVIAGSARSMCNIVQSSQITSIVSTNLGSQRNFPGCGGGVNECEGAIFTWRTPDCSEWQNMATDVSQVGVGIFAYYLKYQVNLRVILNKSRTLVTADEFSSMQAIWERRESGKAILQLPLQYLPIEVITQDQAVCWREDARNAFNALWFGSQPTTCFVGTAFGKLIHRAVWVDDTTLDIKLDFYNKRTVDTTQPDGTVDCDGDWQNPPATQMAIGEQFLPTTGQ